VKNLKIVIICLGLCFLAACGDKEAGYSDSQIQEMMKQGKAVSPEKKQDK